PSFAERPPSERDGKGTNFPRSPKCFAPRTTAFFTTNWKSNRFFYNNNLSSDKHSLNREKNDYTIP
ncbi:MAG: hypothetical protein QHC79_26145, partial [Pseudosphingobacterium sp.]|nr:hypothetical protein [Pseudosphingobacterium sp.]